MKIHLPSHSNALLVAACSLLLGLISGLGQLVGFFGRISVFTALASLALAGVVVAFFPHLLEKELNDPAHHARFSPRRAATMLGGAILLVGTAPFAGKLAVAASAHRDGSQALDLNQNAPARVKLARSARYYDDLGMPQHALRSRIALVQAEAALGDLPRASATIAEIEQSRALDDELQARLNAVRGILAYQNGQFEQAARYYQLAHQSVRKGSRDEAALLQNEGVLWIEQGSAGLPRSRDNFQRAEDIYRTLDDELGLAQISLTQANLHAGNPAALIAAYDTALVRAHQVKNPLLIGTVELNLGKAKRAQGRYEEAERHYGHARSEFEKTADMLSMGELALSESMLESSRGRNEAARQHLSRATGYFQNLSQTSGPLTDARRLARLTAEEADLYDRLGASKEAEDRYKTALGYYGSAPDPAAEAAARTNFAALLLRLNRGEEALQELRRAREIVRSQPAGNRDALGTLHNNLGVAYQNLGELDAARDEFRIALALFDSSSSRLQAAEVLENIAIIDFMQDRGDSVALRIERALAVYAELGYHGREVKSLYNLLAVYSTTNDERANLQVPRMLRILKEHEVDQETESTVLFGLLPQDLQRTELIGLRERVQQLHAKYKAANEGHGMAMSLWQLVRIEQALGNHQLARGYAQQAEPHASSIPLPRRIAFHSDVGMVLIGHDPARGFANLWTAFDLLEGQGESYRLALLEVIDANLPLATGDLRNDQRAKLNAVVASGDSAAARAARRILHKLPDAS